MTAHVPEPDAQGDEPPVAVDMRVRVHPGTDAECVVLCVVPSVATAAGSDAPAAGR